MALITLSSSIPGQSSPDEDSLARLLEWLPANVQNAIHVPAFAILAMLVARALVPTRLGTSAVAGALAIALTVAFGALDEWHQFYVPGRYSTATDLALDTVGALLGAYLARRWRAPLTRTD